MEHVKNVEKFINEAKKRFKRPGVHIKKTFED